jgi:hypothetical protein
MRNVFDQYSEPENRLTHALASALAEDPRLLSSFVRHLARMRPPGSTKLRIIEQGLPGEPEVSEEEADRRGLPDICIHDSEGWAVLVESKVAAPLRQEQLERHLRTAQRRGFGGASVLAIAMEAPKRPLRDGIAFVSWPDVYRWAGGRGRESNWARRLREYMEVAEARMVNDGYLREGTLTEFCGFPFDEDRPFSYIEAKRVLRLAMKGLRGRGSLRRKARADLEAEGRSAITGKKGGRGVWDFIPLQGTPKNGITCLRT